MKQTKEELLILSAKLQKKIEDELASDEIKRKNISQFLGSFKLEYYDRTKEVKVLRWPEIYFELGKLIAHSDRLENLTAIRSQIDYLMEQEKLRNETK